MLLLALGCRDDAEQSAPLSAAVAAASRTGAADLTVVDATQSAFSLPMSGLTSDARARFFVGNSLFNQNWVTAPASVTSRDGLGPLFNARSCSGCHFKDGRGRAPVGDEPLRSAIVRLSAPGEGDTDPRPDPRYGAQLQTEAISGVPAEGKVRISYLEQTGTFADGTPYSLRTPRVQLEQLGYGPPAAGLLLSLRVAPQLIGLGLLEAVADSTLQALADPDDADGDGISGRTSIVSDAHGERALGRFGWKAEHASLRDQTAAAFQSDMGITSRREPRDSCTDHQTRCRAQPHGGDPELDDRALENVVAYLRTLALPAPRPLPEETLVRGRRLFARAGCSACHVPSLRTRSDAALPLLAERDFSPFTDMLLHDMGEQLADHRPVGAASGREWRTPPLWGLGLFARVNGHTFYLHDGRARDLQEAILFHGGEAQRARDAFVTMDASERATLLRYLESL